MAQDIIPQVREGQHEDKAVSVCIHYLRKWLLMHSPKRETLKGMSRYRINPTRIETADTTPWRRGGQGVVIVGNLTPPGASDRSLCERLEGFLLKLLKELSRRSRGEPDELPLVADDELVDGGLAELAKEVLKRIQPEAAEVLDTEEMKTVVSGALKTLERKVAVKKLEWPRNDAGESTKFFKVPIG